MIVIEGVDKCVGDFQRADTVAAALMTRYRTTRMGLIVRVGVCTIACAIVRKHYPNGGDLIEDVAGAKHRLPRRSCPSRRRFANRSSCARAAA